MFHGERFSTNPINPRYNVTRLRVKTFGNSGGGCIQTADAGGVRRIILLGYDCQHTGGKAHWHGDHPRNLGNAKSVNKWAQAFGALSREVRAEVINCTRETALRCWSQADLERTLWQT